MRIAKAAGSGKAPGSGLTWLRRVHRALARVPADSVEFKADQYTSEAALRPLRVALKTGNFSGVRAGIILWVLVADPDIGYVTPDGRVRWKSSGRHRYGAAGLAALCCVAPSYFHTLGYREGRAVTVIGKYLLRKQQHARRERRARRTCDKH